MAATAKAKRSAGRPRRQRRLDEEQLLELVQRQTFEYFWDGAHPVSGLAFDRRPRRASTSDAPVASGASGFGVMALLVACERRWITRAQALARLARMLDCLERATCYHGMYPHFLNGASGATVAFSRKDDGADLVESSYLFQGLLCARAYFEGAENAARRVRERITNLWQEAEWNWFVQPGQTVLTWHWSATNGFALDHPIRGWSECLITYLLAAGAPRYAVPASVYHEGWAQGAHFRNGRTFEGVKLPLGPDWGGPLFFAHLSFCGLDPRGLRDRYADYWQQNSRHVLINREHCVRNPHGYKGYGALCWGLTASDDPKGYDVHAPGHDNGTISPTAAVSSLPYAPQYALQAFRFFHERPGLWGPYGFKDAFCDAQDWSAQSYL